MALIKKGKRKYKCLKRHAAGSYLDLNEVRLAQSYELRIRLHLLHIPGLHQGQSVHRPLPLDGQTKKNEGMNMIYCIAYLLF